MNKQFISKTDSIIERFSSLDGVIAMYRYKIIKNYNEYCRVEINLLTGRTHQIRVHFKSIDHPILGDSLYSEESNLIDRQALHAYKVSFYHPITHEIIKLEAPIPEYFEEIIKKLENNKIKKEK